jgi:hypothetical protein
MDSTMIQVRGSLLSDQYGFYNDSGQRITAERSVWILQYNGYKRITEVTGTEKWVL